jgi:hypothetical protein
MAWLAARAVRAMKVRGGVLVACGGHAGAVGDENVLAGVELVPFIEQGGFGVFAHADAADLVDVETGILVVVLTGDIFAACGFEHFGALGDEVGGHLIIIVVIGDRGDKLRDAPLVFLIGAQADVVLKFGNRFTLHAHIYKPGTGFGDAVFPGSADAGGIDALSPVCADGAKITHIAALEAEAFMFVEVAERGNKDLGRTTTIVITVGKAVESGADIAAIIVKGDIVAEESIVVAETLWESCRLRV